MSRLSISAATLLLAGCSQPEVEAQLMPSCGPLDGPAFEIAVPDGERTVHLYGPGWPDAQNGAYALDASDRSEEVTIALCDASHRDCEWADSGTFAVAQHEDGGFGGTLTATFPKAGSRRIAFVANEEEGFEPPMCG
ncbi:hypothetical protein [Aurantiacibacter luteus]|uniref:Lipoprotein n=1 Tax=Aurantiacibacter luteus TaxID=1581420 RepID=A0A0G9MXQ0_9SPHN|nr:hypothetical protein [Aurantiacibacter luteus]KLE34043.1 hypothetical protein AAW00_07020 [Aurantiacibacter luteus]